MRIGAWPARLHYLPLARTSEPTTIYGFRDTGASSSRSCAGPGLPCRRPTEPPAHPSCSRWLDVVTGIGRIWTRRATQASRRATHSWLSVSFPTMTRNSLKLRSKGRCVLLASVCGSHHGKVLCLRQTPVCGDVKSRRHSSVFSP